MNIPVFEALIDGCDDGIMKVSLVDDPAIEREWQFYDKDRKQLINFSVEDEYERKILTPVMRANFLIYRYSESFGEYYIKYSPETIKKMAEKLMVDGYQNKINLFHEKNTDVEGVNLVQLFIKDSEKGISPKGFEDVEDGSLFAEYHIENDTIWEAVKDGTFNSVSLEGYFTIEEQKFSKKLNKLNTMKNKIKEMLKKMLMALGAIEAEDGTVLNFDGDVIEVGTAVTDDNGEPIADGEYTYEGKVYTVAEGKVTDIKDVEETTETTDEETETTTEEEVEAEDEDGEDGEDVTDQDETDADDVDALKAEIDALKAEIDALKKELEEVKAEPAADTVVEEFEKKTKLNKDNVLSKSQKKTCDAIKAAFNK